MTAYAERMARAAADGLLRLYRMAAVGSRHESRRRRLVWGAVAIAVCAGTAGFNATRQSSFEASLQIFPRAVPPYPPVSDPAYYRGFLGDPELRRQMDLQVGPGVVDYDRVTIAPPDAGGGMTVTAGAVNPAKARAVVNALGPQLAGASARQLAARAARDLPRIEAALAAGHPSRRARAVLRRQVGEISAFGPNPPHRAVVGPRAGSVKPHRLSDRAATAIPGDFPTRPGFVWPALAGLAVVALGWLMALVLAPPAGAVEPMAERLRVRGPTPSWIGAIGDWFTRPLPAGSIRERVDTTMPAWATAATVGALALAGLFVFWLGRGSIFLSDEWTFILTKRGGSLDVWFKPLNEHLMLIPIAVFKGLFATVGIDDFRPYRLQILIAHLACVGLVFLYARRRLGPLLAAALAAPVLLYGPGFDIVLYPINIGFLGSALAGVGMLFALDRGTRRGDAAAGALLALSLSSSSLGVCFAIGAAVEIALRREWRRALYVLAAPVLLYATWYLSYNLHPRRLGPLEPAQAPQFAFHEAVGTFSALFGVPLGVETEGHAYRSGLELIATIALLAAVTLLARHVIRFRAANARLGMLVATALSFWLVTGVARAYSNQYYASRYMYPGAILLLLIAAEALRRVRVPRRTLRVAVVIAAGAALVNAGWLLKDGNGRREDTRVLAAELGALELVRDYVPADLAFDDKRALYVTPAAYFRVSDELGSPAMSTAELAHATPEARHAVDALLGRAALRVTPYARTVGRPAVTEPVFGSAATHLVHGRCVTVRPPPGRVVSAVVALPERGLVVSRGPSARVTLAFRRFGSTDLPAPADIGTVPQLIAAPPDRSPKPWLLTFSVSGRLRIC